MRSGLPARSDAALCPRYPARSWEAGVWWARRRGEGFTLAQLSDARWVPLFVLDSGAAWGKHSRRGTVTLAVPKLLLRGVGGLQKH